MKEYKDHPLADLFPLIPSKDLKELAADIKANGQQNPIILLEHNGEEKILDGRNRYRACLKADVEPLTRSWDEFRRDLTNPEIDPLDWIVSMNLKRRHLNDTQRESVAAEIVVMREAKEKEAKLAEELAMGQSTDGVSADSSEAERVTQAAGQLNVKERNVRKAVAVKKRGSKKLNEAHKAGQVSTATAEKISRMSQAKQDKLAKAAEKNRKRVEKIAAKVESNRLKKEGKVKKQKGYKDAIETALEAIKVLAVETGKLDVVPTWEEYNKKVVVRLKALV